MPLAGITGDYNQYVQVQALLDQLKYVDELVCQQLMDLEIDPVQAESLLVEYGLYTPSRAKQRVQFFLHNRAYIVNYHYGQDCVANYVKRNGRATTKDRWLRFEALLSRPLSATQILTLSNEDWVVITRGVQRCALDEGVA